jgi:molybdopterin molybdotransferase
VAELLSIDAALACVLEHARPLPVEEVAVADVDGRVLREPAVARVDLPPFPSSAMDGFAVRAADLPGELPVAFRVAAGSPGSEPLPAGAAAGISTGGAVPHGADTVVPVEVVDDRGESVVIAAAVTMGQHVRQRGSDVAAGTVVAAAGTRMTASRIGSLAAGGIDSVVCAARPRVSIVATGSELRAPGTTLEPGQIYESNRAMIAAVLARAGAVAELLPVVEDDRGAHRQVIASALESDIVVTSGGVSMGEHDLVRSTESELGVEELFWGVAVKPGKPLSFGIRGDTLVFGLPGNPVSTLVGTMLFVAPAVLARQGASAPHPRYAVGRASSAFRRNAHRDEFVRAVRTDLEDAVEVAPISGQESHMIARAATADAIVHVPRGEGEISAGSAVRYLALD